MVPELIFRSLCLVLPGADNAVQRHGKWYVIGRNHVDMENGMGLSDPSQEDKSCLVPALPPAKTPSPTTKKKKPRRKSAAGAEGGSSPGKRKKRSPKPRPSLPAIDSAGGLE